MIKPLVYGLNLCLLFTSLSSYSFVITGKIILNSKLIKAIDGKSFGIHGDMIHALLKIRTRILHMLYGIAKGDVREGLYLFNNIGHTAEQLALLEEQGLIDTYEKNILLAKVKEDFSIQIHPFIALGRGFKPQMLIFIDESLTLHKRNHTNSILLKWAETKDGDDMAAFKEYVKSFKHLEQFLFELLNFLDDLVSSCPLAKQQFIDNLKTEKEKTMYTQRFNKLFEQQKKKINDLYA